MNYQHFKAYFAVSVPRETRDLDLELAAGLNSTNIREAFTI